jgi:hypothetical protein
MKNQRRNKVNIKSLSTVVAVLLLSIPAFAGPKKADFPLTVGLYSEVLGDVSSESTHCFYSHYAVEPNGSHIGCYNSSDADVHLYAVGLVNGERHTYRIQLPQGENLPTLLLHPDANQPQPPVNNVFPARLDGPKKLQILASRNGKLVVVKALILYQ